MRTIQLTFFLGLVSAIGVCWADHGENDLFQSLTDRGVLLGDGSRVKLPPPAIADEAGRDEQTEIVEQAAGRISLSEFTRNSWTARFPMSISSLKSESGKRLGQSIDVSFIAYGTLKSVEDNKLLEELSRINRKKSEGESDDQQRPLEGESLASRGIDVADQEGARRESFHYFQGTLLDKVSLSGAARSYLTRTEKSTLVALAIDERFTGDKEFPNQWRPRTRNSRGVAVLGDASPYSGFGGYVKATELEQPAGAMLVEMHFVFDEPHGWFQGRNLLRAKVPLAIKENVQTFRRRLRDVAKP